MHAMRKLNDEEPTDMIGNKEKNLAGERSNEDLTFVQRFSRSFSLIGGIG